jgi:hypothetical protein
LPAWIEEQALFQPLNFLLFRPASATTTRTCESDHPGGSDWEDKVPPNARQSAGTAPAGGHAKLTFNAERLARCDVDEWCGSITSRCNCTTL